MLGVTVGVTVSGMLTQLYFNVVWYVSGMLTQLYFNVVWYVSGMLTQLYFNVVWYVSGITIEILTHWYFHEGCKSFIDHVDNTD